MKPSPSQTFGKSLHAGVEGDRIKILLWLLGFERLIVSLSKIENKGRGSWERKILSHVYDMVYLRGHWDSLRGWQEMMSEKGK